MTKKIAVGAKVRFGVKKGSIISVDPRKDHGDGTVKPATVVIQYDSRYKETQYVTQGLRNAVEG